MPVNKNTVISIFIYIFLAGCIEPFTPDIDESDMSIVIEGHITDKAGDHYINISRSSPYNDPKKIPETSCHVEVIDNYGNTIEFYESEPGVYKQWLPEDFLNIGTQYKLKVIRTNGSTYESDFNELSYPGSSIDNIYYNVETRETDDPDKPLNGIQFYLDLEAPDDYARYYRWQLEETWEYKAKNRIQYYYDGAIHEFDDPFSLMTCWKTQPVAKIYTSTTSNTTSNTITKFPLNYVSGQTNKLKIKYSILVKQYSLSEAAYNYWNQLQKESQERGSLYETQPANIQGNIYNINDPEEMVFGFFDVSSVTEKRIIVDESFRFRISDASCDLRYIWHTSHLRAYTIYPVYMISLNEMGTGLPYGVGRGICFDCTTVGGVTEKPDFWK